MILDTIKKDKYLYLFSNGFNAISVFDHVRYDRSDYDILSPPQRKYLLKIFLENSGVHKSGRQVVFENDFTFTFPRANSMSPSPGDVLQDLSNKTGEFLILTPTQMAYALIKTFVHDHDVLLKELHTLISKQPINIDKILDYSSEEHKLGFLNQHVEGIRRFQNEVVLTEAMKSRKHLGAIS